MRSRDSSLIGGIRAFRETALHWSTCVSGARINNASLLPIVSFSFWNFRLPALLEITGNYSYICKLCGCGVGWVGWGGIIINVVVASKCVTRCGCFEVTCHARAVWVWGGVGGVGRDNYKRCSCIEVCDTLWLFWSNMSRARCVGVGWGGWGGAG